MNRKQHNTTKKQTNKKGGEKEYEGAEMKLKQNKNKRIGK